MNKFITNLSPSYTCYWVNYWCMVPFSSEYWEQLLLPDRDIALLFHHSFEIWYIVWLSSTSYQHLSYQRFCGTWNGQMASPVHPTNNPLKSPLGCSPCSVGCSICFDNTDCGLFSMPWYNFKIFMIYFCRHFSLVSGSCLCRQEFLCLPSACTFWFYSNVFSELVWQL